MSCFKAWGACLRDPRCENTQCPQHPAAQCSTCKGGHCNTAQACHRPLAELPVRIERRLFTRSPRLLPSTREGRGRLIGAVLATGGVLLFIYGPIGRYLGWH